MKYLLLVCRDAERMNAQTSPIRARPWPSRKGAPRGWTISSREASGSPATSWPRRAGPDPSGCATGSWQ